MLTNSRPVRTSPLTILFSTILSFLMIVPAAFAQEETPFKVQVLFEPENRDYSYRKDHQDKTIKLMLYGFQGEQTDTSGTPKILKDRQALNSFFKEHWENIRQDYFANDPGSMRLMAGEESFTSKSLNSGPELEPAKMVGMTVPVGKFTVGGGYTWGEKNPALMLQTAEGFIGGVAYDTGRTGFQLSYLTSGQKFMGFEAGGTDTQYSSIMFGTSFRVNKRMGITATAQYRADDDPLTTGDRQAVFTIGTKWKF